MKEINNYKLTVRWTSNNGVGTLNARAYERSHSVLIDNKAVILGSSDPIFHGDKTKYNPEEFLVASLSACHMLAYLYLCTEAGVVVIDYVDNATGIMVETPNGGGRFTEVTLNPSVIVTDHSMMEKANNLHKKANEICFIANSVNFPVIHRSTCEVADK